MIATAGRRPPGSGLFLRIFTSTAHAAGFDGGPPAREDDRAADAGGVVERIARIAVPLTEKVLKFQGYHPPADRAMSARPWDDAAVTKAALRERFRAYRAGLDEEEYAARSASLVARLKRVPELAQAGTVHTYWPLVSRREVDLRPLIDWLQASGKQIVLPVVDDASDGPRLRHVRFESAEALRPRRWGLHEPTDGKSVPIEEIDAVVVPALGAGRNGHRLGYGKGYYDAFLRAVDAPSLCPVFAACLVDRVPPQPHDVPLDLIITEDEILRLPSDVTSPLFRS